MKKDYFKNFDITNFWYDCEYALKNYVEDTLSIEIINSIEKELGYKLPASYIYLMETRNGGMPLKTCHSTITSTSWAENHIAISGISGIGRNKINSLCGELGSQFMINEWGYPNIGIVICDCPSAGHDVVMLDSRKCGKDGEPEVVHVDQDYDYNITFLAKDFETFILGLKDKREYGK